MGLKTIERRYEEFGETNCQSKTEYETYIQKYVDFGVNIYTTILTIDKLSSEETLYSDLFIVSPAFFSSVFYNFWAMAVIHLNAFFAKNDSGSLFKFIEFLEKNHNSIFTKKYYDVVISGEGVGERKDVILGSFEESMNNFQVLIEQNNELINKINIARNRIFAHFDKNFLLYQQCALKSLSIEELYEAINLVESLINIFAVLYNGTIISLKSINGADIYQTAYGINLYIENKQELINKKYHKKN